MSSINQVRLERLVDERARREQNIEELTASAEKEERLLNEFETEQREKWRGDVVALDSEIAVVADEIERANNARDVSKLIRVTSEPVPAHMTEIGGPGGPVVYRTFAAYARDQLIARFPAIAREVDGPAKETVIREQALERLTRVDHTLTSDVQGLLPPQHMAQIMDIINNARPVVATARGVPLDRGKLTYPKITQRPEVLVQGTEKTEAGTANMQVELDTLTADTFLGGGNLSWQAINWSTPDALQLWFDLAAEAYARQTETAACSTLGTAASGTVSPALGTAGTESFGQWRAAAIGGASAIYTTTGGRARTDTLYLSADMFFNLAGVGTADVVQMSAVGNLDIGTMTGTFSGFRVVGSYGFSPGTAILGDRAAFLVGETAGAPVEMRAVEPAIGGLEVGVIGAFKSKVFDSDRFLHLT